MTMESRWLLAFAATAIISLLGCKTEEQCWIDHTAEVSFCHSDYFECVSGAETGYDESACLHDAQATCLDEADTALGECAGSEGCVADRSTCEAACDAWDDVCLDTCKATMVTCAEWYLPDCEAGCDETSLTCWEAAEGTEAIAACEEDRRACAMCCYGVEYDPDRPCS